MNELKEIFEGWAEKKYPDDGLEMYLRRVGYTAACNDFVDVCLRFAEWIGGFEGLSQCRKFHGFMTNEDLFNYFLRNVYNN